MIEWLIWTGALLVVGALVGKLPERVVTRALDVVSR
jgi:hypothetical protein